MTITYIQTNTIGAGNQFAFIAAGDVLVVLSGVTLGSTTSTAFSSAFGDVEVNVLGTVVSASQMTLATGSSFVLGAAGSFLNFSPAMSSAGLYLNGANSSARIEGTFSAPETIGLLTSGGNQVITVTGSITAASGLYLIAGVAGGDNVINAGHITATTQGDVSNGTLFNNAIFVENANTRITNMAGGVITATGTEANGVRGYTSATGLSVTNQGTITSVNSTAIHMADLVSATGTVINTGLIQGATNAFLGAIGGTYTIVNAGHMIGNVSMGGGNDRFDGRGGRVDGLWSGNDGGDLYDGRGASLISGVISGGNGNDTLLGGDGAETINGDAGTDILTGGDGDDSLFGGADFDDLSGGAGNDILRGDDGVLLAHGGSGDDEIYVTALPTAYIVAGYGGSGDDYFEGGLIGDILYGGANDDTIFSGEGDDFIFGGAGDDDLNGFEGLDILIGGAGDDALVQALGNGQLFGGRGFDTLSAGDGADSLDGGTDEDVLDGDAGLDTITGGSGDDQIFGGSDNDVLDGGNGSDALQGGTGNDRVTGSNGSDLLLGDGGNDTVVGGAGEDTLQGGSSRDLLIGGTAADHFVLIALSDSGATAASRDAIADFRSGQDRLDLSTLDADAVLAGNQGFTYIGSTAFGAVAGQLRYSTVTGLMEGDVNGDSLADFTIEFQNFTTLAATDLLL